LIAANSFSHAWLSGSDTGLLAPPALPGEEAMFTGQAFPRMESQTFQDHPLQEGLAGGSRRISGVAVFTGNHNGEGHSGAIISGSGALPETRRQTQQWLQITHLRSLQPWC